MNFRRIVRRIRSASCGSWFCGTPATRSIPRSSNWHNDSFSFNESLFVQKRFIHFTLVVVLHHESLVQQSSLTVFRVHRRESRPQKADSYPQHRRAGQAKNLPWQKVREVHLWKLSIFSSFEFSQNDRSPLVSTSWQCFTHATIFPMSSHSPSTLSFGIERRANVAMSRSRLARQIEHRWLAYVRCNCSSEIFSGFDFAKNSSTDQLASGKIWKL